MENIFETKRTPIFYRTLISVLYCTVYSKYNCIYIPDLSADNTDNTSMFSHYFQSALHINHFIRLQHLRSFLIHASFKIGRNTLCKWYSFISSYPFPSITSFFHKLHPSHRSNSLCLSTQSQKMICGIMIYGGMVFGMQRTCGISILNAGTGTSIVRDRREMGPWRL